MRVSVLVAMVVFALAAEEAEPAGLAPTSLSDQTLQAAIKDKRYLLRQIKCTLGEAPCDPVGRKLKGQCLL